jgi:hypothetical protein
MTLLAIDLRVPARELMHYERDLRQALFAISPGVLVSLLSFLTLGIFWVGSAISAQSPAPFRHPPHLDSLGVLVCRHSHAVFHQASRDAPRLSHRLLEYWGNILIFGAMLYASWGDATRAGLIKDDISPEVPAAVCRRIIIGQSWYAFGCCALRLQHLPQRADNHLRPVVLHPLPVAPRASHRKPFHCSRQSVSWSPRVSCCSSPLQG